MKLSYLIIIKFWTLLGQKDSFYRMLNNNMYNDESNETLFLPNLIKSNNFPHTRWRFSSLKIKKKERTTGIETYFASRVTLQKLNIIGSPTYSVEKAMYGIPITSQSH
jgi:hypothetical protein